MKGNLDLLEVLPIEGNLVLPPFLYLELIKVEGLDKSSLGVYYPGPGIFLEAFICMKSANYVLFLSVKAGPSYLEV